MKTGWLSPTGELIECEIRDHVETAHMLCEKLGYVCADYYHPDDTLLAHRWVHITRLSFFSHNYMIFHDVNQGYTPEQIRYLRPFFEDENTPIDEYDREMFFKEVDK